MFDIPAYVSFTGVLASFLAIGAMVAHALLSKHVVPTGPVLVTVQWVLAFASLVSAIFTIIDDMNGQANESGAGIALLIGITIFGIAALIVGAIAIDAYRARKRAAATQSTGNVQDMGPSKYSLGDEVTPSGGIAGTIVEIKLLEAGEVDYGIKDTTGAVNHYTESSLTLSDR